MKIDYSAAKAFRFCPDFYRERYVKGIELDWSKLTEKPGKFDFGTRMHQLLEQHYRRMMPRILLPIEPYPEHPNEQLEAEVQNTFALYVSRYPVEPFSVLDIERVFDVPLNERHSLTGKIDIIARDSEGVFGIDHKTESRNSKANSPKIRASSTQFSLYQFALQSLYSDERDFGKFCLNIITRQSPAGREPATFLRDGLDRSAAQLTEAVRDVIEVADTIESYLERFGPDQPWPRNRDNCVNEVTGWECDFYSPHLTGWSDAQFQMYRPAKGYLENA